MASIFSALLKRHKAVDSMVLSSGQVERANGERLAQLKQISRFSSSYYVLPLFLLFYIADLIYYSSHATEFLCYRLATVTSTYVLNIFVQRGSSLTHTQVACTGFVMACAMPLQIMLYRVGDAGSPYYAGLILVMIGMSSGFRFTWRFYFLNVFLILAPLTLIPAFIETPLSSFYFLNLLFLLSTTLIQAVTRIFNEKLHLLEYQSRVGLETEISGRDSVIKKKTKEAVDLVTLTKQFSPQVVHAIREGKLDISGKVHRSQNCVLFIDIIGSTERFIRLDREDLHRVLSMYMEDTMSSLLKYDITIDKFLGDGILAFSNDPIPHDDYIERVLLAALEIKNRISQRQDEYDELWMSTFEVSVGISSGFASVGFYGSDLHFKSYTAIGRVVNLAARLGSAAVANQILVSQDIVKKVRDRAMASGRKFNFHDRGRAVLKGFESDDIKLFELAESEDYDSLLMKGPLAKNAPVCPDGHGLLFLDTDESGIFVFKCRTCGYCLDEGGTVRAKAA